MAGTAVLMFFGLALPMALAEKCLLTLCVVGFSWGFAVWTRGDRQQMPPVALLGPMLAWSYPLFMGFYSYSLGLALVPWGWAIAQQSRGRWRPLLAVGVLATLAWFAHLVPCLLLIMGAVIFAFHSGGRAALRRALVVLTPALALVAFYLTSAVTEDPVRWELGKLLETLVTLRAAAPFEGVSEQLAMLAAAATVAVIAMRAPGKESAAWLLLAGGALAMLLALPDGSAGHWFLSERLALIPWLAIAPLAVTERFRLLQMFVFITLSLASLTASLTPIVEANEELFAYAAAADALKPGETVLGIDDAGKTERIRPFLHAVGWIAIERRLVDASNYEPHTRHFQTRHQPYVAMPNHNTLVGDPAAVDFKRFASRIRYILVYGVSDGLAAALAERYMRVDEWGALTLFERR